MSDQSSKRNRLAKETSPYLLQHQHNPVDWYPWGNEAFEVARATDKPILLSIGYAACHWCHVMAHESFESESIANLMNGHFVNIKIDREERPDIDRVYMDALHAMGEQGGWPLTIFLTPELKPFWGGTYFPPEAKYGRPSFPHILTELSRIWREERSKITSNTQAILDRLKHTPEAANATIPDLQDLQTIAQQVASSVDNSNGGIGSAPKFPQSPLINLLWISHQHYPQLRVGDAVWLTMNKISQGGIYDHLGGGIARYTVDDRWLIPHFEKMLYDNAQYVSMLCQLQDLQPNELFRNRIAESVTWLTQSMLTAEGMFASSYDADSEGVEGKYYCWSKMEIESLISESTRHLFCTAYDVTEAGNWEHTNILNRISNPEYLGEEKEAALKTARSQLLTAREKRVPPGWDDKMLTDWNALTVSALFKAGATLQDSTIDQLGVDTLSRLTKVLHDGRRLYHSYRNSKLRAHATADDYAHLIAACIDAYEANLDSAWITTAQQFTDEFLTNHSDETEAGFFFSSGAANDLIIRKKYATDDVTPNANAIMAINLWKLSHLTGDNKLLALAMETLEWLAPHMQANPFACPTAWVAFLTLTTQPQLILAGQAENPNFKDLHSACRIVPLPNRLFLHLDPETRLPSDHIGAHIKHTPDEAAVYFCHNQTCSLPITDSKNLLELRIH